MLLRLLSSLLSPLHFQTPSVKLSLTRVCFVDMIIIFISLHSREEGARTKGGEKVMWDGRWRREGRGRREKEEKHYDIISTALS